MDDNAFYEVQATSNGNTLSSNIVQVEVNEAPDLTPPIITLVGADPLVVECGDPFIEPGFSAIDNRDGDISAAVTVDSNLNTNMPGFSTLSYEVDDAAGNSTTVTRSVQVVDLTPPSITVNGPPTFTLACGAIFNDPGVSASDTCSGNLSADIEINGDVNTAVPGSYVVTYRATDDASNEATAFREVIVEDQAAPVLELLGDLSIDVACGASYSEPGFGAIDVCAGDLSSAVVVTGSVDSNVPGSYVLNYSVTDPSGNQAQASREVVVRDLTAPTLTLNGSADLLLECGTTYAESGATALDECDGDLSDSLAIESTVDTAQPGIYEVSYTVSDGAGNQSTATRTVTVQDTQAPALTLTGPPTISVECGDDFAEPGASANDDCEGDLTGSIEISGAVDTQQTGSYTIQYTVTDNAGNESTRSRTVQVVDNMAPSLSLVGAETLTLACGDTFTESGFTASDTCDGDLSSVVETLGAVDTTTPGEYVLTYRVSDGAGNSAQVSRAIIVEDNTSPSLSLNGSATITLECGDPFSDPGAQANDECDGAISSNITVDGTVDRRTPGLYTLSYRISDASGNEASLSRVVEVVDTTAPNLTLTGAASLTIPCGETFSDPGASANDACDGLVSASIRLSGRVDTDTPGAYPIVYTARDSADNVATQTRTVTVVDDVAPAITLNGPETVVIGCGQSFVDPGATAEDGCDGLLAIEIMGEVDIQAAGAYELRYEAMDSSGNLATVTRTVQVNDDCEIAITSQPNDLNLYTGSEARFRVTANAGSSILSYAWFKDGIEIPNANSATLILDNITLEDSGVYSCFISDEDESIASREAILQVFERPASGQHSADINRDWAISLSELLRLIQFFNTGQIGCADGTEDGYAPTSNNQSCAFHDSDYNPQDWRISLSELLRAIQFFNVPGGQYRMGEDTEDGFAPGAG